MQTFIKQNDILSPPQYGFRKAHSTQHAILDIASTIQENMGKRLFSCGVFIAYKSHPEKLLKLQKLALRFIYFSERNQHAIPLFIDAGVLPLKFLYYELLANLMFEIRHSNAPGNIQDLFQDISDIHSYNTRFLCLK